MSDRERQLNLKPLIAYESLQRDIQVKQIPGFNKHDEMERENFRRFNRKGLPSRLMKTRDQDTLSSLGENYKSSPNLPGLYTARGLVRQSLPIYQNSDLIQND
jgi:hypothetical protein